MNPLLTNVVRGDRLTSSLTLGQFIKAIAAFLGPIMAYAFYFQTTDENGNRSAQYILFENYRSKGVKFTRQEVCGFDLVKDKDLVFELTEYVQNLNHALQEGTIKVFGNAESINQSN